VASDLEHEVQRVLARHQQRVQGGDRRPVCECNVLLTGSGRDAVALHQAGKVIERLRELRAVIR
jgi:hypothetical protein